MGVLFGCRVIAATFWAALLDLVTTVTEVNNSVLLESQGYLKKQISVLSHIWFYQWHMEVS